VSVEQLDLFEFSEPNATANHLVLNGFYYEERTRRFVSFVLGKRHFEILASRCKPPKWPQEWQDQIMRERSI
jgi:hypothetical protein